MNVDKNGVSEFARLSNYLNEIDFLCDNIIEVSDLFLHLLKGRGKLQIKQTEYPSRLSSKW